MRQVHKAGEKLFVDWAGAKIPVHDQHTGAVHPAPLFVATLGASSYTFAKAVWTQELGDWIGVHLDAFQFLGGLPELLVPDNLRTGVTYQREVDWSRARSSRSGPTGCASWLRSWRGSPRCGWA